MDRLRSVNWQTENGQLMDAWGAFLTEANAGNSRAYARVLHMVTPVLRGIVRACVSTLAEERPIAPVGKTIETCLMMIPPLSILPVADMLIGSRLPRGEIWRLHCRRIGRPRFQGNRAARCQMREGGS